MKGQRKLRVNRLCALFAAGALLVGLVEGKPARSAVTSGTNGLVAAINGAGDLVGIDPTSGAITTFATAAALGAGAANPSFAPSGAFIALNNAVTLLTVSTSGAVSNLGAAGTEPEVSPDNTTLIYQCGADVCTRPASGGLPTTVEAGATDPDFTPAGTSIVYVQGGALISEVLATGVETPVPIGGVVPANPRVGPGGTTVFFDNTGTGMVSSAPFPGGGAVTAVGGAGSTVAAPSPDGLRVAFNLGGGITVVTLASGATTPLPAGPTTPSWGKAAAPPPPPPPPPPAATPTPSPTPSATPSVTPTPTPPGGTLGAITGTVFRVSGRRLRTRPARRGFVTANPGGSAVTGRDGRYRIGAPAGQSFVSANLRGRQACAADSIGGPNGKSVTVPATGEVTVNFFCSRRVFFG